MCMCLYFMYMHTDNTFFTRNIDIIVNATFLEIQEKTYQTFY